MFADQVRRNSTRTITCVLLTLAFTTAGAVAREIESNQAEWAQSYDMAPSERVGRTAAPILSAETRAATERAIDTYRAIVQRGGWLPVVGAEGLRTGSEGAAVVALRERLAVTGDLDPRAGMSEVYDSFVCQAVRHFQARHGLIMTGEMNAATVQAMNVPAEARLQQLETNVARLNSYTGDLGRRFVITNLPSAVVETVEDGRVVTRHNAGIGKIDRQSPIMNTHATVVNFNPTWTVPASIVRKDLIPKMQTEPGYLTENHIHILSGGHEVAPASVNWHSNEATHYTFRQDSGAEFNAMGFVRINIPNPYGVFMHDTNSKGVFGDDFRSISSGCVRVQNVREYITWLLKDTPGWGREKINEAIESGRRVDATIAGPVQVYWTYITAWSTPEGVIQFRDDVYRLDHGKVSDK